MTLSVAYFQIENVHRAYTKQSHAHTTTITANVDFAKLLFFHI